VHAEQPFPPNGRLEDLIQEEFVMKKLQKILYMPLPSVLICVWTSLAQSPSIFFTELLNEAAGALLHPFKAHDWNVRAPRYLENEWHRFVDAGERFVPENGQRRDETSEALLSGQTGASRRTSEF
jgi:hypothetical protein